MSKGFKMILGVASLLGMSVLIPFLLETAVKAQIPYILRPWLPDVTVSKLGIPFLPEFLFWGLVALLVLLFVAFVVVLFYPRTYTEVELSDDATGTLLLKKAALEGFVTSIVTSQGYMANPAVKATLYKKKFRVKVAGKVIPRVDVVAKTARIEQEITRGLQEFFGINRALAFSVVVKHIEEKKRTTSQRVR